MRQKDAKRSELLKRGLYTQYIQTTLFSYTYWTGLVKLFPLKRSLCVSLAHLLHVFLKKSCYNHVIFFPIVVRFENERLARKFEKLHNTHLTVRVLIVLLNFVVVARRVAIHACLLRLFCTYNALLVFNNHTLVVFTLNRSVVGVFV